MFGQLTVGEWATEWRNSKGNVWTVGREASSLSLSVLGVAE